MGVNILDYYSILHLLWGSITFTLINSINIPLYFNFILTNGLHLLIEILEHNKSPTGKILENTTNHISDILFFLIGWLLAFKFNFNKFYKNFPLYIKIILWVILILQFLEEIMRELFPYTNFIIFKGAFIT
jgi:hypothetical protein